MEKNITEHGGKRPRKKLDHVYSEKTASERKPRATRSERSFGKTERSFGGRSERSFSDRKPRSAGGERSERSFGDRKPRTERGERSFGERKSFSDRKPGSTRGERSFDRAERKPYSERSERSFSDRKPRGERSERSFGDRKPRAERGERSFGERKSFSDRKPRGERSERSFGERKSFSDRKPGSSRGERSFDRAERKPYSERSERSFSDRKPRGERSERSFGERKSFSDRKPRSTEGARGARGERSFDRAERKPYGDRSERSFSDRKPRSAGNARGERSERSYGERKPRATAERKPRQSSTKNNSPEGFIRLNKYISNSGVCSRREADELIASGAVKVNGEICTVLGTKVGPDDVVNFGGETLKNEKKVYLLMNKPKGYITTLDDPNERKTVMELIKDACKERIYPVGRLDRNTTGVLLFTNDGELAKRLTHPSHGARKIYHATLDKALTKADMKSIAEGVELEDGTIQADEINYVDGGDKTEVGVQIHSGRNRIIRRIFEHFDYTVTKLDRVLFAELTKKDLKRGAWRFLTEKEINFLRQNA